jgi:hypothetical protein
VAVLPEEPAQPADDHERNHDRREDDDGDRAVSGSRDDQKK